jgi:diadenosine tetraphosphate (Ap4A) HIT family hydrolase
MNRNRRTETMGHEDLTPLTEQILARMGREGADIRARLKKFYRRRSLNISCNIPEPLGKNA